NKQAQADIALRFLYLPGYESNIVPGIAGEDRPHHRNAYCYYKLCGVKSSFGDGTCNAIEADGLCHPAHVPVALPYAAVGYLCKAKQHQSGHGGYLGEGEKELYPLAAFYTTGIDISEYQYHHYTYQLGGVYLKFRAFAIREGTDEYIVLT